MTRKYSIISSKLYYVFLTLVMSFTVLGCFNEKSQENSSIQLKNEPFFFIQIADPQIFWGPHAEWEKAISHINRLKPAFVVVCGDLVEHPGNQEEIDAYLQTTKKLEKIPLFNVAGNHDIGNKPSEKAIRLYEKKFGKIWYSFIYNKSLCIVIDTNIIKSTGKLTQLAACQMQWLKKTLQEAEQEDYQHKFVFTHYPFCLKSIDEKDEYFNLPLKQRSELLQLFDKYNVTAVFSGHYHRNAYVKGKKIELITTSSSGKALGIDPLGFRIVKVYPTHIEHSYFAYEKLPKKVGL